MLIDISSHAHLILFRVQSIFTIEEPEEVIGSHLIRMQKESATKLFAKEWEIFLTYSAMAGIIWI
jgi:hypothetical protein